jgi:hypothetical protein
MKDAIIALGIILFICIFGGFSVFISYLEDKQPIVAFQIAYAKNMECRSGASNSQSNQFINGLCGKIPQISDFIKEEK